MEPNLPDKDLLRAFRSALRRRIEGEIQEEDAAAEGRRARIVPLVRTAVASARARGLCTGAALFGSFAWGKPGERSDVDLLVYSCPDVFVLAAEISRLTLTPAHVVRREEAPASLVARVDADGIRL